MIDQLLGWIATVMFTAIYFPCVGKHYKRMLIVGLVANVVALVYAVIINQLPLMIKYVVALICILGFIKK